MSDPLTHTEVEDLLGVFAIHATSEQERILVEAHLAGCQTCRAELDRHLHTAARLGAANVAPVPARVWENVLREVRNSSAIAPTDPVAPPVAPPTAIAAAPAPLAPVAPPPAPVAPLAPSAPADPVAPMVPIAAEPSPVIVDLAEARTRRPNRSRSWRMAIGVAAATAAVAIPATMALTGASSPSLAALAKRAAGTPGAVTLQLKAPDGGLVAKTIIDRDGHGYFVDDTLPKLSPGKTYQLWTITRTGPVSAGLLGSDPDVTAFSVDGNFTAIAVSIEDADGAVAPTQPIAQAVV